MTSTLESLGAEYVARESGVELREMAGGWVVMTRPEQHEWVGRMLRGKRKMRLSRPALETMAIVAYKQPVTKSEIEAIRGVDASGVLATLLERNLVTIKGRSTVVGRPLLYGTTGEFLNYFGLRDLAELPRPEELRALVAAREPEQLEMMELDPTSGMPLALSAGSAAGGEAFADAAFGVAEVSNEDVFSIADADAAIAQAKAARADVAAAFGEQASSSDFAGAGDLASASDDGGTDDGDDDDEFEDEDEDDDELDDAYDDEDDEDDDEEEEDAGEDARLRSAVLDEHGGR